MQTIGERLEDGRKRKGISIREAAEATKIRGDYLQKFENNQFDIGLTDIYVRGFLRSYAVFLKLPADRVLSDFASLGRGDARPRQPSREIYGRMDVSVASADEPGERPGTADGAAGGEPARTTHRVPRSPGSSLPSLPSINPTLVFKGGIALACVLALVLIIWIGKSIFGSSSSNSAEHSTTPAPQATQQAPAERTFNLLANDTVDVTVEVQNANQSRGTELFRGTLSQGQTQAIPWNGPVYITASPAENLTIEADGKRYPTGQKGSLTMRLPGPQK